MAHPEIRSLAAYAGIDVTRLMSLIECSCDFNDFFVRIKAIRADIMPSDCNGAWARYWELYSQS